MSTFTSIHASLVQHPAPLLPPQKPLDATLTSKIADLKVHPTLETALHLLNLDLPAAHFLVRHMQSAPAFEGMYLHGILHRIEGDYDNARAWYSDVRDSEVYKRVWGKEDVEGTVGWKKWREEGGNKDGGQLFLDKVQTLKEGKGGGKDALEKESRKELESVVDYCTNKFGTEKREDATSAWVCHDPEIGQMGEDQVSGDSGRRKF